MNDIKRYFENRLKEDEQIIWCGKPKDGILVKHADLILIPMSVILMGFALIFDYVLIRYNAPFIFVSIGIVLTLTGIYFLFIRFYTDKARRKNIFYCLTTKRILMLSGRKHNNLKELPLRDIIQLEKSEDKDGSGFILFGFTNPLFPWLFGTISTSNEKISGLESLTDVNDVYEKISTALNAAATRQKS